MTHRGITRGLCLICVEETTSKLQQKPDEGARAPALENFYEIILVQNHCDFIVKQQKLAVFILFYYRSLFLEIHQSKLLC